MSRHHYPIGRVFRCAWCHKAEPVRGGLLYFTYTSVGPGDEHTVAPADAAGLLYFMYTSVSDEGHTVAPADAAGWSRSDGICPAHLAAAANV